jgi:RHS repeat-associated protein
VLSETGAGFQPFGFAGGLYDATTEFVRFGARDYDPATGRWTAKDVIGFAGRQANQYVYVNGDPVNRRDPSGLADIFLGVEGDLNGVVGGEGGFGIVFDTDNWLDSGIYGTVGFGAGANVGVSVCGGYARREIEGWGTDIDINAGKVSPTFLFDEEGFNGMSFGVGPGVGASIGASNTWTLSIGDLVKWFR